MNKAQKVVMAITLLIIAIIALYPPMKFGQYSNGREFIFSMSSLNRIDMSTLFTQILIVIFLGGGITILLSLKKK